MRCTLVVLILLTLSVTGCATAPQIRSGLQRHPEVELKLTEANAALDRLNQEITKFYADVEAIHGDTVALYHQPGWQDMQEIIEETASSEDPEGEALSRLEDMHENGETSGSQNAPWQSTFSRYLSLVQRCNALEIRRLLLLSSLRGVQSRYLAAAYMEFSAGRDTEGKTIYEIVEVLGRSADELDAYSTNEIGLYDVSQR